MLAGPPSSEIEAPAAVKALAAGRPTRAVWQNEMGGLTFEITGPEHVFVKWAATASGVDLDAEAIRLSWAQRFTPVPRVLEQGRDEAGTWMFRIVSTLLGRVRVVDWLNLNLRLLFAFENVSC